MPPPNYPTPFLTEIDDENPRCADPDPHGIFLILTVVSALLVTSLVGPFGSSFFLLSTFERAYQRWKVAASTLGGVRLRRRASAPTSPILGSAASSTRHWVLQNFFKNLLNRKDRAASSGTLGGGASGGGGDNSG